MKKQIKIIGLLAMLFINFTYLGILYLQKISYVGINEENKFTALIGIIFTIIMFYSFTKYFNKFMMILSDDMSDESSDDTVG